MSRKTDWSARPPRGCAGPKIETKFVRLRQAVPVGYRMDGWRVCWAGGWDRGRVFFVVMVDPRRQSRPAVPSENPLKRSG